MPNNKKQKKIVNGQIGDPFGKNRQGNRKKEGYEATPSEPMPSSPPTTPLPKCDPTREQICKNDNVEQIKSLLEQVTKN